ncbi:MAG TPA: hypothetical protein PL110_04335 [Candidatus Eremiobacteraeota bacterium]|nr:MAG: hypothetical protein BWY64_00504 [bacterium ADurb.Bin363]HPZ07316.1 hypothetical protein [Candidatus Eremiobacteraeota bacterium]
MLVNDQHRVWGGGGIYNTAQGGRVFSKGFTSGMNTYAGASAAATGTGNMTPYGGSIASNPGIMSDADIARMKANVARNAADIDKRAKTSRMGSLIGKVLGFAAGIGAVAAVVGTGGLAAVPLTGLLMAGGIGAGMGSGIGYLLGGGGHKNYSIFK